MNKVYKYGSRIGQVFLVSCLSYVLESQAIAFIGGGILGLVWAHNDLKESENADK